MVEANNSTEWEIIYGNEHFLLVYKIVIVKGPLPASNVGGFMSREKAIWLLDAERKMLWLQTTIVEQAQKL